MKFKLTSRKREEEEIGTLIIWTAILSIIAIVAICSAAGNIADKKIAKQIKKTTETISAANLPTPNAKNTESGKQIQYDFYLDNNPDGIGTYIIVNKNIYTDRGGKEKVGNWELKVKYNSYSGNGILSEFDNYAPFKLIVDSDLLLEMKPSAYLKKLSPEQRISFDFLSALDHQLKLKQS